MGFSGKSSLSLSVSLLELGGEYDGRRRKGEVRDRICSTKTSLYNKAPIDKTVGHH